MNQELKKHFGVFKDSSIKMFRDFGGLNPTAALLSIKDGKKTITLVPMISEAIVSRRSQLLHFMGDRMRQENAVVEMIMFASEAWAANHDKDTDMSKVPMPSQDSNKIEVMIVSALTKDGKTLTTIYDIVKNDRKRDLKERPSVDEEGSQNFLLSNFFRGYLGIQ